MRAERFAGVMSGTSLDGVDAVVAEFAPSSGRACAVLGAAFVPFGVRRASRPEKPRASLASISSEREREAFCKRSPARAAGKQASVEASERTQSDNHDC